MCRSMLASLDRSPTQMEPISVGCKFIHRRVVSNFYSVMSVASVRAHDRYKVITENSEGSASFLKAGVYS